LRRLLPVVPLLLAALGGCGDSGRIDAMLNDLAQGRPEGLRVRELGPADADAVPKLLAMLRSDRRRFVQRALIDALVSIGSRKALPALEESIALPDAQVRYPAAAAHWKLGGGEEPGLAVLLQGVAQGDEAALAAFATVAPDLPQATVDALVARVAADPSWSNVEAIAAIGPRAAKAEPILRAVVADPARLPGERVSAAWALERTVGDAATAAYQLVRIYRDPNPFVRRRLVPRILELGALAPGPVVDELEGLLVEDDPALRAAGAWVLGRLGARAAAALPALKGMAASDPSGEAQAAARDAIGRIGKEESAKG